MAVRRISPAPTPKERQVMDRVSRAKKSQPKIDRHGVYMTACRELADETGCNFEEIWEEWGSRAAVRYYLAEIDHDEAEALAMQDVRERVKGAN